jgi:hypothetical protein
MKIRKTLGIITAIFFVPVLLLAGGCATGSSAPHKDRMAEWEWVPNVWVENSFTFGKYKDCIYDDYSNGYLCPPGTR